MHASRDATSWPITLNKMLETTSNRVSMCDEKTFTQEDIFLYTVSQYTQPANQAVNSGWAKMIKRNLSSGNTPRSLYVPQEDFNTCRKAGVCTLCGEKRHFCADCKNSWRSMQQENTLSVKAENQTQLPHQGQGGLGNPHAPLTGANTFIISMKTNDSHLNTVSVLKLNLTCWDENLMWHLTKVMMDDSCEFNTVCQLRVKELGFKLRGKELSTVNFNSHHMRIYSLVNIMVKVEDSIRGILWLKKTFLSVQEVLKDFILELSFLMKHNPERQYCEQQIQWKPMMEFSDNTLNKNLSFESLLQGWHTLKLLVAGVMVVMTGTGNNSITDDEQLMLLSVKSDTFEHLSSMLSVQLSTFKHLSRMLSVELSMFKHLLSMSSTQLSTVKHWLRMLSATVSNEKELMTILLQYEQLKDVFRLMKQSHLSEHNLFDHSIDLVEGKKPPFRPLYSMFLTELKALHEYITKNLEAGLIHHFSLSAVSAMMFVLKKDSTL